MSYEIKGVIEHIGDSTRYSERFVTRPLVLKTEREHNGTTYTNYVKLQLNNDNCDLVNGMSEGEEVRVSFNIGGRKFNEGENTKYFTDLTVWKIECL